MVQILKLGTAKCQMSGKEGEGVLCKFSNGMFEGFLSWQSFKQMCRMIASQQKKEGQQGGE